VAHSSGTLCISHWSIQKDVVTAGGPCLLLRSRSRRQRLVASWWQCASQQAHSGIELPGNPELSDAGPHRAVVTKCSEGPCECLAKGWTTEGVGVRVPVGPGTFPAPHCPDHFWGTPKRSARYVPGAFPQVVKRQGYEAGRSSSNCYRDQ
jgi:hypothetical protein